LDSKSTVKDFNDGTGAYTIKPGTTPTAGTIDLAAFDGYHGGHVYTRNLHIHIPPSADQMTKDMQQGKYDLAGTFTTDELVKLKSYQKLPVQDLGVTVLGLNSLSSTSPFKSLPARQAAAYALNIPAILKAGNLRGSAASQIIPLSISGYDPSIKVIPYNPAKAKQLLSSVSNASAPVTLDYNDDHQTPLLSEIAKELNAVGFNVQVSQKDFNTVLDEGLGGKVGMFYATVTSNTLDGADIFNSTLEGNQVYKNSEVDTLLTQANTIIDPASRLLALQKISRLVASQTPYVPLYNQTRPYVLTKPYQIQTDIPSGEVGAYFWQVYQK
jgi:peptide/nickel transport system substrate-binding protein